MAKFVFQLEAVLRQRGLVEKQKQCELALIQRQMAQLQAELPSLSSNSQHITVEGATHYTLLSMQAHAAVVSSAIRSVVEAAHQCAPVAAKV